MGERMSMGVKGDGGRRCGIKKGSRKVTKEVVLCSASHSLLTQDGQKVKDGILVYSA
jgi:hypothetical protein